MLSNKMILMTMVIFGISLTIGETKPIESLSNDYGKRVVCYYTNWAQYRNGNGKFFPEDIQPNLCTHIMYSFSTLEANKMVAYEWNDENTEWSKGMYERTTDLKKQNPDLKILIAIGGWNAGSRIFSDMVHSQTYRAIFIQSVMDFFKAYNFDGLDLDWEYPGSREGSKPTDKALFTTLCKELKDAFNGQYLLTAAVAAGEATVQAAYEVAQISEHLDFINLMAYDLHGSWEKFLGHNAPLYSRESETGDQTKLNVDWAVQNWISKGVAREKLVLGLATYGRSHKLANTGNNQLGDGSSGAAQAGQYTREAGFLAYYEICHNIKNNGWSQQFNSEQQIPYAFSSVNWVGYDDENSLRIKVKYAKKNKLGGIMFWALDLDDFTGSYCGNGKYPLINAAKDELYSGSSTTTTTKETTKKQTTTTEKPITTTKYTTTKPVTTTTEKPITTTTKETTTKPVTTTTEKPTTTTKDTTTKPVTTTTEIIPSSTTKKSTSTITTTIPSSTTKKSTSTITTTIPSSTTKKTTKVTTKNPSTTTTIKATTNGIELCPKDGYYADLTDTTCSKYYICEYTNTINERIHYKQCGNGLRWDSNINTCNHAAAVDCNVISPL